MKKERTLITIALCFLLVIGWGFNGANIISNASGAGKYVKQAEKFEKAGLYQKAILSYEKALEIHEKKSVRDKWIEAYKKGHEDAVVTNLEYKDALMFACKEYPKDATYWEKLIDLSLGMKDYKSAYSSYNKSVRNGAKSKKLKALGTEVTYAFGIEKTNYSEIWRSPSGKYTRLSDTGYSITEEDGKPVYEEYAYISPVSDAMEYVITSQKDSRQMDAKKIVQSILPEQLKDKETRAVGSNLIPVKNENQKWQYLDCGTGKYLEGEFTEASSFTNGIAAVIKDDKWMLVDGGLQKYKEAVFEDVKLYGNGEYTGYGYMVASENGSYALYSANGEKECDLNAYDADVYLGEYIAIKDKDGLWGYADLEGETVIKPQYKEAKSFSHGLGAVFDGKKWGFIDKKGNVVIDYQFDDADYFNKKGVCYISEKAGLYNKITLRFP